MGNYILSVIRTAVPAGVGALLIWLASEASVVLDTESSVQLTASLTALAVAGYYALARALERRWPWVGSLLLGLGAGGAPTYVPEATSEAVGRAAYTAYRRAVLGLSVNGDPLPEWDGLSPTVRHAWTAGARAATSAILTPPKQ